VSGPREQTTEAAAKAIREHYDFTEYGGYSEALSCCRNAEDHELHQAQMVADAVVEALALTEEWTWSWPENLTGTGEPGYGFSVDTEQEARAEADSWMSIVRRWVSGWSVVGGQS
jgi:hypothetical protein